MIYLCRESYFLSGNNNRNDMIVRCVLDISKSKKKKKPTSPGNKNIKKT